MAETGAKEREIDNETISIVDTIAESEYTEATTIYSESTAIGDANNENGREYLASSADKGVWGSNLAYLLMLVGYAVGFGNIWRFPYQMRENGGLVFMIAAAEPAKPKGGKAKAPKKAAAPKEAKPKAAKPKAKPADHPPTAEMVAAAIKGLGERQGSSLKAIKKYIGDHYKVDVEKLAPFIRRYVKTAVTNGSLVQVKGKGANGSFRLPAGAKGKTSGGAAKKPKAASSPKKAKPASPKKAKAEAATGAAKSKASKAKKPKAAATPKKAAAKPAKGKKPAAAAAAPAPSPVAAAPAKPAKKPASPKKEKKPAAPKAKKALAASPAKAAPKTAKSPKAPKSPKPKTAKPKAAAAPKAKKAAPKKK